MFPPHVVDLIDEIRRWRSSREWYQKRSIPWKRGWVLYGVPGTGKTALARAFAEDLDLPVFVFNLAEMTNRDLVREWRNMLNNVPCIALIEDIDNVFHGRENVTQRNMGMFPMMMMNYDNDDHPDKSDGTKQEKNRSRGWSPLTFDCLLNCIDGIERSEGIFTVITTNDISKLDEALGTPRKLPDGRFELISTRPGRVDRAIELTYMTRECKHEMARRILGDFPEELVKMRAEIEANPDDQQTPAQFQFRCGQIALLEYWLAKDGKKSRRTGLPKPSGNGHNGDNGMCVLPDGRIANQSEMMVRATEMGVFNPHEFDLDQFDLIDEN